MKSCFCICFFVILGLFASAARAADTSGVETVLRLDQARLVAMMAGDGAGLARLFSDAVVFIHSDGRAEGKMDYIKSMTAGDTAYANVKTSVVQAQVVTPDVIVLTGAQDMRKKLGPTWSDLNLRFMSVWRNEAGTWRMIAWQSLRPAGTSVVPTK